MELSNYTALLNFTSSPASQGRWPVNYEWQQVAYEELSKFGSMHDRLIAIFDKLESSLLVLGLFGNFLALITLWKGRHMQTPSFVYHKVLILAYFIYCFNFLSVKFMNIFLTVPAPRRQLVYYTPSSAYYALILNRVITSVCGYVALYTSLAISVDRFVALVIFSKYNNFNRNFIAYTLVGISLVMSIFVHSWAPWIENEIETVSVLMEGNYTILAYRYKQSIASKGQMKDFLMAKDWYNLITRFIYAVALTILTSVVIYMFTKQQKKRLTLCSVSKRQRRRERSLFYLMVAVVIMAYIQVIPREAKRIFELVYPADYVGTMTTDNTLSISTRRSYLLYGLYGLIFTTPILNLCSTIERSLIFYLYFALNHSFRAEVLRLLSLNDVCNGLLAKFGLSGNGDHVIDGPSRNTRRYSPSTAVPPPSLNELSVNLNRSTMEHQSLLAPNLNSTSYTSVQTVCTEYSSAV